MLGRIGGIASLLAATAALIAVQAVGAGKDETIREKLHGIYLNEASGYKIYRDSSRKEKLILNPEPVYVWTNPIRGGEQDGEVFVWTCRGRAEVVATFFSFPRTGPRSLHHEMHSLGTTTLDVSRAAVHTWHPTAPGMDFRPIPDAPRPVRPRAEDDPDEELVPRFLRHHRERQVPQLGPPAPASAPLPQ